MVGRLTGRNIVALILIVVSVSAYFLIYRLMHPTLELEVEKRDGSAM